MRARKNGKRPHPTRAHSKFLGIFKRYNVCCLIWTVDSAILGPFKVLHPWERMMSDEESRAGYFLGLLNADQWERLQAVKKGLDVPKPVPTQEELEEAHNAECR